MVSTVFVTAVAIMLVVVELFYRCSYCCGDNDDSRARSYCEYDGG